MTHPLTARRATQFIAVTTVVLLALTGCVKIHSSTGLTSDNLITQDLILAVDPSVLEQLGVDASELSAEALIARLPESSVDRVTIEDYTEGDLEGVIIHAEGLTLEEFNATTTVLSGMAESELPDGAGGGTAGQALDGITGVLGGILESTIERQGDEFVVTIPSTPSESSGAIALGITPEQIAQAIDFAAVFTFPGPVIEATRGEVNGKTVTLDVDDLQKGGVITIRAGANDAIAWGPIVTWALIIVAALVIVGGATALILTDRARRKQHDLPQATVTDE